MRRSFLVSDAAKTGFRLMTRDQYLKLIDDNKPAMVQIAKRIGDKDEEIEEFLSKGREFIVALPEKSVFDDLGLVWTLQMQLDEITAACSDLSLPLQDGITIGATPLAGINARQMRIGDASLVDVTISLMRLSDLVAKVIANTIDHVTADGKPRWRVNANDVKKRLETEPWILDEWRRIIKLFATHKIPPSGVGPEPRGAEAKNTRVLMVEAMELWVVAHEVCHHLLKHGTDHSTKNLESSQEEHQADILSRYVLVAIARRRNTRENDFLVAGIGASLALGATNLVDRAKAVLDTGNDTVPPSDDHPTFAERLSAIRKNDADAFPLVAARWEILRRAFIDIFDIVWSMLKPGFEELHRQGVRSARL